MTDSYFVSKPSPHLANFAKEAQKSALGIQDDVYGQRLRDAAKKSQQSQQHGFQMGQIDRKGGVDAYTTGLGMGINLPQTLAGQRDALATGPIRDHFEQARVAGNLDKISSYLATLDKQGLRVVPKSVQNVPLSGIQNMIRLGGAPTGPEADIAAAKAQRVGTDGRETTKVFFEQGPDGSWAKVTDKVKTDSYRMMNPQQLKAAGITTDPSVMGSPPQQASGKVKVGDIKVMTRPDGSKKTVRIIGITPDGRAQIEDVK